MVSPENVATPWSIVAVSVPPRLPPAGSFAIETVTVPVAPVTSEPSGLLDLDGQAEALAGGRRMRAAAR